MAVASPGADGASNEGDLRTSIRPTVAEINLDALEANAAAVRGLVGPAVAVYGVVKADAYGHGAVEVARALVPRVNMLAVSLVEEGLELRRAGIDSPILVMSAYYGGQHADVVEADLTPVIYDESDLDAFNEYQLKLRGRGPRGPLGVHLKFDTGMSRLGFSTRQLRRVADRLDRAAGLQLRGVATHFACADLPDSGATEEQLRAFEPVCQSFVRDFGNGISTHAANSAGMAAHPGAHLSAVRPGLALYGAMPTRAVALRGLRPTMTVRSRVMSLRQIARGRAVSYGAEFRAQRPSTIATLPIGYADGYPRHVVGAHVLIAGRRAPVVGAVCMDMLMIDVTDIENVSVGSDVVLLGQQSGASISVDELAAWAGTVNYEIMCGISKRVPRIYTRESNECESSDGTRAPRKLTRLLPAARSQR